MVKVIYVQRDGARVEVEAEPGDTVMSAAVGNLVPGIVGDCGGGMSCATCHVFVVDEKWLERVGRRRRDEDGMLEMTAVPSEAHSRLGCQIVLDDSLDGLVVHVPERQE